MAHQSELIEKDILAYLKSQEEKSMLRFITCGSVDDGKSTLIGRLLWDSKLVFEDQLVALEADSKKVGTQGGAIDYALLMDGLQAEREQGITIDVAYRYFSTDKRKFIVADTPGHEQYTRNMVTGASTAQVAVILVDARKGLLTQTRRHSYLVSLVGIRHIVLAVNKMDLIDFDQQRFDSIVRDYEQFAASLGFAASIAAIPISALNGDNIIDASDNTPWYHGPTLINYLETVRVEDDTRNQLFRFPVQWVNRPHLDFRGFCGTIVAGAIRPGDELQVVSSGRTSRVARIVTMNGDLAEAVAGQAVTLTLTDEIDISRGDMLAATDAPPRLSRHPEANLVWLHDEALQPGKIYLVKTATAVTPGRVTRVQFAVDVNSLEQKQAPTLGLNEIGVVRLELDRMVAFDPYRQNRETGSFILIDRFTNATVAAGMVIAVPPPDSQNMQLTEVDAVSSDRGGDLFRRFSLSEFSVGASGMGVADLTGEWGQIGFEVSASFLDYLGKGNRVLFRLRDLGQLEPVALLAYEQNLNFEFGRDKDRINVILYQDRESPGVVHSELDVGGL
jgi:sulfate adenylyltransferase large subunit